MSKSTSLICGFTGCNLFLENSVILPCFNSICEYHIEQFCLKGVREFECNLCDVIHDIPDKGFPLNKTLNKLIQENSHLTNKHLEAKLLLIEYLSKKGNYINQCLDSKEVALTRLNKIRENIEKHKDHLLNQVNEEYKETLNKLDVFQEKLMNIIENKTKKKLNDDNLKQSMIKLRQPNLNENEIEEIELILKSGIENIDNYENELFSNNSIEFIPKDITFGELKIVEETSESNGFIRHSIQSNESGDRMDIDEINNHLTIPKIESIETFKGHTKLIRKCIVFENLRILLSASEDNTVRVWNLDTAELIQTLKKHTNSVTCLNKIPGKTYRIITGSSDKLMHIWNYNHSKNCFDYIKGIDEQAPIVRQSFISDDSYLFINGLVNGMISIWSLKPETLCERNIHSFKAHAETVACLIVNERYLITSSDNGEIKIWSFEFGAKFSFKLEKELIDAHKNRVFALEFLLDKKQLISGSDDKLIKIWDIEYGTCVKIIKANMKVFCIKFITEKYAVIGGVTNNQVNLKILDSEIDDFVKNLTGHKSNVFHVELLENGYFLTTSTDKSIKLWKISMNEI
jgi:WD40 repeat protein